MSAPDRLARANRRLVGKLLLVTVAMFGFGFALVPLYKVFCQVTGVNAKPGRADAQVVQASRADTSRWVTVEFTGQAMNGLPWEFRPLQSKIRVRPGETAVAKYFARNLSAEAVTGLANPSVSPPKATAHFKKVECFCFTRQELKAGESREMLVRFLVERDLPEDVKTLTLSYAFFNVGTAQAKNDGGNAQISRDHRTSSVERTASGEAS